MRAGGDVRPVDPATAAGRVLLTAFAWADQTDRLDRLRGALELAARVPADLRAEPATTTVARLGVEPGSWTVVWHSIMRQYLDEEQRAGLAAGIEALGAAATDS